MKKKLTILMFSLLISVGWTSPVSAQTKQVAPGAKVHSSASKMGKKGAKVPYKSKAIMDILVEPVVNNTHTSDYWPSESPAPAEETPGAMLRAPRRANHTADFTAERSWYETFEYQWEDANGDTQTSKLTDPATNGHQMAALVKYVYNTPGIPGILYSDAKGADHEYPNIEFGYDIAPRGNSTTYGDIYIDFPTSYVEFSQIQVYVGDNTTPVTQWYSGNNGTTLPTNWSMGAVYGSNGAAWGQRTSNSYFYVLYDRDNSARGGYIRIKKEAFAGQSGAIKVYVRARKYSGYNYDAYMQVNHQYQQVSTTADWYEWTILPNSTGSIEKPTLNGYTAFIVKVKDQTYLNRPMEEFTHSWSDITNYFDNYMDAIELLTDGVRIGGTSSNAGTVFSYTGSLNRFYFITKGKMAYLSSLENSASTDRAPFYSMYEEYAPTTTTDTTGVKDFFERMDQGEAYGVVHDCQSVNYMEHYFSMTGKDGTTHNTMSNLLFYIPDDRGSTDGWRNYDHQPRVGLYTAEIEATAKPNKTQEHVYDVYINWSTSLQTILGFDEPETHDLWVVVKDDNGNVVLDSLLTTSPDTTYTYQVPQYPEGYTIDYIIRAWPTTAPYPVDHDANSAGTFYADSDPAQVLIPGYNDFISLVRRHYESDFDLSTEHNFYRNFMTLSNQNETGLTAADLSNGSKTLKLMRYDLADPSVQTEAADVTFTRNGNTVNWLVNYLDQQIYHGHTPSNKYELLTQGSNPVFPTSGTITVSESGTSVSYDTTYVLVDSISFYYDYGSVSAGTTFTVNDGNWSSSSNALYMNSSRFAYIRTYSSTNYWENYLTYTVPSNYGSNETLAFDVYVGSVSNGNYIGCDINGGNFAAVVNTPSSNQYYTLWVTGLKAGDEVNFYGATPASSGYNNAQSPNIADIMVFRQQVEEVEAQSALLDMSGITLVDQFSVSTADNEHPKDYGYQLKAAWDEQKTSNVMEVPVMKTNSTLNGFYTFYQMIHDSIPESELLPINVRNGDLEVPMRGDAEIFFNTIGRKSTDDWTRMSYMQFDNNHTFYTEGINYLPQYFGEVAYPGDVIERLDNATLDQGGYNTFNSYVPVIWTYGYRPVNKRHYFDSDSIHNSYGAPIWNTGVGKVDILNVEVQRQVKNTQTNEDNPATTWTDEDGQTCNVYFLGVNAIGELPTTNMKGEGGSNYYEPYMFRVWVKSNSGSLRGFTPMSSENNGDYVVNNTALDHNLQVVYEEYTKSTELNKSLPQEYVNARNIIKFGALKGIDPNDLQVIVRFYYKVKHLDPIDDSMNNMVTIDFTDNPWQIPAGNVANWQTDNSDYTDGNLTIGLANKYFYNENIGFLMLGENGQLTLPTFNRKVKQIQVVGRPGASNTVKMNVFVGNTAVSTEETGSLGTNTFNINEQYQTAGTQYILKVTNAYNAQISKVIVIFEEEETTNIAATQPKANDHSPVALRRDGSDLHKATNNKSK